MRWILPVFLALLLSPAAPAGDVFAESASPHSGVQVIETKQPFSAFTERLTAAIKKNKMGLVAQACANCGAKSIGVTIPGNRVFMIFRPDFAVRMLKASEAAGIEAPIRLYVTEQPDGAARLSYRLPSHTFGDYKVAALDELGAELDVIVARIVEDSLK